LLLPARRAYAAAVMRHMASADYTASYGEGYYYATPRDAEDVIAAIITLPL